ncbi:Ras association domain family member 3 [Phyllostomus discolor]|uniref:Ras association domain family member 3 n=1 Tax=Phyllostomus discolor TaxID=89673 RepID=A0A834AZI0_9CHIR|nr:Ras association domain family member 3 [Phyllostomus discolor]
MGTAIYKLSGKINFQVKKTHIPEGKYICHSYCRDLVHLDYPQNGKLPTCLPTCEVRLSSQKYTQEFQAIKWHR